LRVVRAGHRAVPGVQARGGALRQLVRSGHYRQRRQAVGADWTRGRNQRPARTAQRGNGNSRLIEPPYFREGSSEAGNARFGYESIGTAPVEESLSSRSYALVNVRM